MGQKGITALLIAENGFIHEYFQNVWGDVFREFRSVRTARGALKAIRETNYNFIFINEYLPDGNPLDLLPKIKQQCPRTKVVFLITHKCDSERLCGKHGAGGTLLKPFRLGEVEALLGRLFSTCRGRPAGEIPAPRKGAGASRPSRPHSL